FRSKRSMIWAEEAVAVAIEGSPASRLRLSTHAKPQAAASMQHDFGADATVGVDFQKQRVPQPAVDDVRLADAAAEAVQAGLHLGDHAGVDHAALDQLPAAPGIDAADQRRLIAAVTEDAGRVGQQHELLGPEVG